MNSTITVSIASYRDSELVRTVKSAWTKAKYPENLHFTIVSQGEDYEHPDLSFIPSDQLTYHKYHWKESKGACWAREIGSRYIPSTYFLQIDSHSRFRDDWDMTIVDTYLLSSSYYGEIILTAYPQGYKVKENGEEEYYAGDSIIKVIPKWYDGERMAGPTFVDASPFAFGDEINFISAGSIFCHREFMYRVPYDKFLYFHGEELSLALRFYTRGIKLINTPVNFMFHEYKGSWDGSRRRLHWEDDPEWYKLNHQSYERLAKIVTGDKSFGVYGIEDVGLYEKWIEETGIELRDKYDVIMSKVA